ncbi:MAG: Nucleotidyltransferase [Candidatus Nomurabacteria bacterium GW2011_GWA1_46_11]|uniref:Nucleotidyltransferase n=1 Tax=Candidatus Nomurabacteria bacterium GW2011_GWA1_46_11 TaxID=1618732 RepID=A0A0G1QX03_9BACT|nr:MAG: Nucleotidyltransferase [Microgenomates group bacterium GW2011_GWA2_44_7]KKT78280.1 MAG: Nucleotidyltransferase [Microgenomates group bacterium GW2011_GWB1_44_8]KKU22338.1 MAG: Nucleotidyltransferase [Candidatus Nomurabacteria bacterium GW2011_GWA1_46_11]
MLTDGQTNTIHTYASQKPISLVYLFGSQATGDVGPSSDYDFAVLFDRLLSSGERFDLKLDFVNFLSGIVKTDKIDVVDLNVAPVSFAFETTTKGVCLFGNRQVQDDFEFLTFQRFQDQRFYLKRYASEIVARIAATGFD